MYKIIGADGKEYGPVSLELLKEWIQAGRVDTQTRVRQAEGMDWKTAAEFPEIAALLSPPIPAVGAKTPSPTTIAPVAAAHVKNNGLAITSLVLGLFSIILCGAVAGIPAIICGHISRKQIRQSPSSQGGGGLALAGLILGYLSLFLTLLVAGMLLPALAKAKQRATSIQCMNNMRQVGIAFHMWATDHNEMFPFHVSTNAGGTMELRQTGEDGFDGNAPKHLAVLGVYLGQTKVLVCPGDHERSPASNFEDLQPGNVSYRLRTGTQVAPTTANEVLGVCPIHGNVLHSDGSVQLRGRRAPARLRR